MDSHNSTSLLFLSFFLLFLNLCKRDVLQDLVHFKHIYVLSVRQLPSVKFGFQFQSVESKCQESADRIFLSEYYMSFLCENSSCSCHLSVPFPIFLMKVLKSVTPLGEAYATRCVILCPLRLSLLKSSTKAQSSGVSRNGRSMPAAQKCFCPWNNRMCSAAEECQSSQALLPCSPCG